MLFRRNRSAASRTCTAHISVNSGKGGALIGNILYMSGFSELTESKVVRVEIDIFIQRGKSESKPVFVCEGTITDIASVARILRLDILMSHLGNSGSVNTDGRMLLKIGIVFKRTSAVVFYVFKLVAEFGMNTEPRKLIGEPGKPF